MIHSGKLTFALATLSLAATAWSAPPEPEDGACTTTAMLARSACRNETKDDLWIGLGNCVNLRADAAAEACEEDTTEAYEEARHECGEQFHAREDLCEELGEDPYDPVLNPADFLSPAATAANPNPWFPLVPGTTWIYESADERITVVVTDQTRVIEGITAIVVRDTVRDDADQLVEDTDDWFAQDKLGNVWYLGEISRDYEDGELVALEGSWKYGVDFAKPGIIMKASPAVGDVYRQEFALGNAEDAAKVTSITASKTVPAAQCSGNCVVTKDFTPISPDAVERKYYAPGVGLILEVDVETGDRVELVSVTH